MPRISFKLDASFFEYIAIGAIGARAAASDLEERGHSVAELENGSTGTKLWKEVKRKRVRIPDLVCTRCGLRVESRTKRRPDLSMSHSPTDAERAWDLGLVDEDVIAFPACERRNEEIWNRGRLRDQISFWHDRERVRWQVSDYVKYFRIGDFRECEPARSATKGVTEAFETTISWDAIFSTRHGDVTAVDNENRITVRRASDGHVYTWQNDKGLLPTVHDGDTVVEHQVLASAVPPADDEELTCPRSLSMTRLRSLLDSPERTCAEGPSSGRPGRAGPGARRAAGRGGDPSLRARVPLGHEELAGRPGGQPGPPASAARSPAEGAPRTPWSAGSSRSGDRRR